MKTKTKSSISNIMVLWCDFSQKKMIRTRWFGLRVCTKFTKCNNVQKETMIERDGLHRNVKGKEWDNLQSKEKQILREHLGHDLFSFFWSNIQSLTIATGYTFLSITFQSSWQPCWLELSEHIKCHLREAHGRKWAELHTDYRLQIYWERNKSTWFSPCSRRLPSSLPYLK